MEFERYDNGVPSWVDLGTGDLGRAKDFYGVLFGWETPEGPPEAGGYSVCLLRGKSVAGLGPNMNPAAPPHWSTYVNVDSADATVEKVTAAGGMVFMPPMDVMEAGRLAVAADPSGAAFGLWQPGQHLGAQLVNEPGTYCWSELVTPDVEGAKAFYGAVFGWGSDTQGADSGMAYTEWKLGGKSIGGMMAPPPGMPEGAPPFWGVYFAVSDTDATVARVQELGGSLFMPAMDIEPGRFAVVADPEGVMFNVIALSPERAG
jgi:hypothetical protein